MSGSRSSSRWLAPTALVAVAVIVLLIVLSGGGQGGGSEGTPSGEPTRTQARQSGPKVYVVKQGDTLSAIAMDAGVTVETLQQLNPDVDVQALQPGQRLRLRP